MNNEQLLEKVKNCACSCDVKEGHTCIFCAELLAKLKKALRIKRRSTQSPYQPRKLPGIQDIKTPYYTGRMRPRKRTT